jgi:hemoglobin-like flavoprotein
MRETDEVFASSLVRCKLRDDFLERFYQRFLASSREVREKFRSTDMEAQKRKLLRSLDLSVAASLGDPEGLQEIRARARSHGRERLDIRPPLYDLWLESLVETVREVDEDFDDDVERAWRNMMGHVISSMIAGY